MQSAPARLEGANRLSMSVNARQWWGQGMTRARSAFRAPRSAGWLRWLPGVVNVLLVVFIAHIAAELTWSLLAPPAAVTPPSAAPTVAVVRPAASPGIDQLADLHLFGKAPPQQVAQAAPIDAPDTRLNLVLRGLVATTQPGEALAIIADPQGKEKPYHEGDALPGGAVLRHIYVDRVILARAGQLETLRLRRQTLPDSDVDRRTPAPPPRTPAQQAVQPDAAASNRLQELREQYASNPEQLWDEVRITPVMGEGGIRGYTLQHQDRELMQAMGLREQDVITAVNGMPLSDPSVMYDVMNSLSSAQDLTLSVERDGSAQTLHIGLN